MLLPTTITWLIVANAERCRALEERRRGGALRELEAWDCRQTEQDRMHAHHEPAVGGQRFGSGRSVVNPRDLDAQAERRLLTRYAHQLNLAGVKGRYERLILIATPPALGVLREQLGRPGQRSVERTATCDCLEEPPEALRERIRALRAPR
ncbi:MULTISPECIES: host attachment protein [unclassified Phenylobacterium]|uniref:host attachment protein n=1 Tax=unclassified Phenylobacterium TaxID=2640670 RepID=UPI00083B2180|nr:MULTISPECIES: host attachment protein [unclassified Phenylobacterium]